MVGRCRRHVRTLRPSRFALSARMPLQARPLALPGLISRDHALAGSSRDGTPRFSVGTALTMTRLPKSPFALCRCYVTLLRIAASNVGATQFLRAVAVSTNTRVLGTTSRLAGCIASESGCSVAHTSQAGFVNTWKRLIDGCAQ
jgi:hypothetical protein